MRRSFILASCLFFSNFSIAQWTSNTAVNTEAANVPVGDCLTAGTSDGKTYLVYYKQVPAPANYELRAQLIDSNGVKQFGPEGVQVSGVNSSTFTQIFNISVDASNNLIVAFNTSDAGNAVYVHKITPAGTQPWGSGINVGSGFFAMPATLTNGDVIVSWIDGTTSKGQIQRLSSSNGNTQWASPVIITPVNASHRTSAGHIVPISNSNFIILFHDRATSSLSSNFWAQRYDATGNTVWSSPVQLNTATTSYNRLYSALANNDTVYLGYFGQQGGLRFDSYLQRIDPDGNIPWGTNGIDFSIDPANYEQETKICISLASNCIWSACRYTNTSQSQSGVYVQRFNLQTGERQLTDNAKQVYAVAAGPDFGMDGVSLFGDNSPLLLLGKSTATTTTEYGVKLNTSGDFVWAGNEIALGTFAATKGRRALTNVVNNMSVAVWVENKGTEDRPYAQNIRTTGATGPGIVTGLIDPTILPRVLSAYPNPFAGSFVLSVPRLLPGDKAYIINGTGTIVKTINIQSSRQLIVAEDLVSGLYYVTLRSDNFKHVLKLVKLK